MINWKDLIDLDSESGILKAIELLKQMDKTLDAMKGASGELREKYKKDADEIYNATVKIIGGFEKVGATSEKGRKQINDNAKAADLMTAEYTAAAKSVGILDTNMKALDEEQKRVKVSTETLNKVYLANQKVMEQRNLQETNLQKTNVKLNLQLQERKKLLKQQAQEELGLIDAYQKENQTLNRLRKTYLATATTYGVSSKQARALLTEVTRLDQKQKEVAASAGLYQKSVGNYERGLNSLNGTFKKVASSLGIIGGFALLGRVITGAVKTFKEFELENDRLAALLNTNQEGIKELTDDAKLLGQQTAKSAVEVNKLQQAYARLGFTQKEILDLTGDTINGSIALNAELDQTAELTGAVIRSFDELGTSDAGLILDQLTLATQKTALNFDKLQTAIPIASGAAAAAKVPFTTFISQLGQAADRGIDASTAATSLRNIYIELSKKGLTLEEALGKINSSQDKLNEANLIFGKRTAVTALALANTIDKTKELDKVLQGANGTSEKFANETLDNLTGDIKLLESAWQGLILTVISGEGSLSSFFRTVTTGAATAINALANIDLTIKLLRRGIDGLNENEFKTFIAFGEAESGNKIVDVLKKTKNQVEEVSKSYADLSSSIETKNGITSFVSVETKRLLFLEKKQEDVYNALIKEGEGIEEARKFALKYVSLIKTEGEERIKLSNIKSKANEEEVIVSKRALGLIEKQVAIIKDLNEKKEQALSISSIRKFSSQIEEAQKKLDDLLGVKKTPTNNIDEERLKAIEEINKRIEKSSEDLVQSRIEEQIRLADREVKLGDDKLASLEERISLEIDLERRKSAELIKIKDQELKDIESKRQEDLSKIEGNKDLELAINKKYDDILSKTKEAQSIEIININEDLENKITQLTEKGSEERKQITNEELKRRIANTEQSVNTLFDFGNQIGEFASALDAREKQRDEEKFAELEERKEREVALAGENEEAKLNAERKYNEEKAKIEKEAVLRARKIAIFEKTLAVGQAIVSTALGVTKALPNIPLSILVGLLGAAQVATIAATPLPAFAKGTDYAPAGDKIVGELGREMVITPDRKVFLTGDKAEVRTDIPEGSKILTNAITENILANESVDKNEQDAIKISKGASKAHQLSSEIIRQMEAKNEDIVQGFKEAVGGIEVHQWRLGSGGLKKDIRRGNTVFKDVEQENTF